MSLLILAMRVCVPVNTYQKVVLFLNLCVVVFLLLTYCLTLLLILILLSQVDEEIQADKIQRDMRVDHSTLIVTFRAENTKLLRVAMSSFSDFLLVSIKTMMEFDE